MHANDTPGNDASYPDDFDRLTPTPGVKQRLERFLELAEQLEPNEVDLAIRMAEAADGQETTGRTPPIGAATIDDLHDQASLEVLATLQATYIREAEERAAANGDSPQKARVLGLLRATLERYGDGSDFFDGQ